LESGDRPYGHRLIECTMKLPDHARIEAGGPNPHLVALDQPTNVVLFPERHGHHCGVGGTNGDPGRRWNDREEVLVTVAVQVSGEDAEHSKPDASPLFPSVDPGVVDGVAQARPTTANGEGCPGLVEEFDQVVGAEQSAVEAQGALGILREPARRIEL